MSQALYRLGLFSARRPWAVIGSWLVLAVVVVAAGERVRSQARGLVPRAGPRLAGGQRPDRVRRHRRGRAHRPGRRDTAPTARPRSSTSAPARAALAELQARAAALPHVLGDHRPGRGARGRTRGRPGQRRGVGGRARRPRPPAVPGAGRAQRRRTSRTSRPSPRSREAASPLRVELGGDLFFAFEQSPAGDRRGDRAAGRGHHPVPRVRVADRDRAPDRDGRLRARGGISAMSLLARVMDVPSWAPVLGAMVGLGVGIDYALFVVTRHRDNLAAGVPVEESVARAIATAGQPVVFAGGIVVVSVLGLAVAGVPFMTGRGHRARSRRGVDGGRLGHPAAGLPGAVRARDQPLRPPAHEARRTSCSGPGGSGT